MVKKSLKRVGTLRKTLLRGRDWKKKNYVTPLCPYSILTIHIKLTHINCGCLKVQLYCSVNSTYLHNTSLLVKRIVGHVDRARGLKEVTRRNFNKTIRGLDMQWSIRFTLKYPKMGQWTRPFAERKMLLSELWMFLEPDALDEKKSNFQWSNENGSGLSKYTYVFHTTTFGVQILLAGKLILFTEEYSLWFQDNVESTQC